MAGNILQGEEVSNIPFATSPHPMWIYDLATLAFLKVNRAAVLTYGFSEEEFLRSSVLDIRPAADVQRFLKSAKQLHTTTGERWWHVGKNGNPFPVSITTWPLTFQGREAELVLARRDSE